MKNLQSMLVVALASLLVCSCGGGAGDSLVPPPPAEDGDRGAGAGGGATAGVGRRAGGEGGAEWFETILQALKVCADGPVTEGIDVSKWQGDINWPKVAGAGIKFAFIRVSDGLGYPDGKFQYNWEEARAAGVLRGVYQYFRAGQSAEEQAWYLLDQMGPLEKGDLPPVIDVETMDGQSAAVVVDKVGKWLKLVESETGVKPLIYTGAGFWNGLGSNELSDYPLWVANWQTDCPLMPAGWTQWDFWQKSATGKVAGIAGDVDLDVFNGDLAALQEYAYEGGPPPPEVVPCPVAAATETVVEEDAACVELPSFANPAEYNDVDGHGGHAWWVPGQIPDPDYGNGVNWMLDFAEAGTYRIEAYVPSGLDDLTAMATYKVFHQGGATKVVVDQAAAAGGWVEVGQFPFVQGAQDQWVRLGDNYQPQEGPGKKIVLDALRISVPVACECQTAGLVELAPCEGGQQWRECDGCLWSEWSECVAVPCDDCAQDARSPGDLPYVAPDSRSEWDAGHRAPDWGQVDVVDGRGDTIGDIGNRGQGRMIVEPEDGPHRSGNGCSAAGAGADEGTAGLLLLLLLLALLRLSFAGRLIIRSRPPASSTRTLLVRRT